MPNPKTEVVSFSRLTDAQAARLDVLVPHRGPCGFCAGPDARHRLFDAIREQVRAGDSIELVADNYDHIPLEAIRLILLDA